MFCKSFEKKKKSARIDGRAQDFPQEKNNKPTHLRVCMDLNQRRGKIHKSKGLQYTYMYSSHLVFWLLCLALFYFLNSYLLQETRLCEWQLEGGGI